MLHLLPRRRAPVRRRGGRKPPRQEAATFIHVGALQMSLNIISNYAANVAHRNLTTSDAMATSSLAKLSAGTRVLTAKDDAASLAVGSRLGVEVAGLKQAAVNAGQAVSMLQIADGAMSKTSDILTRMKTLAVQAGSDQLSSEERAKLNTEYQALISEVDRISNSTQFAGTKLVDGSLTVDRSSATAFAVSQGVQDITFRGDFSGTNATIAYNTAGSFTATVDATTFTGALDADTNDGTSMTTGTVVTLTNAATTNKVDLQINTAFSVNTTRASGSLQMTGSNSTSFTFKVGTGSSPTSDEISVTVNSISANTLGLDTTDISTAANANTASIAVTNAVDDLNTARAAIGANQNRLEFAAANINTQRENTEAARSQLMDLDVASEMSNFTSKQILIQAGVSMLAQANQMPQNLLQLFR
ncbi:MAG: flagellin [Rhodospirillales bacterium]